MKHRKRPDLGRIIAGLVVLFGCVSTAPAFGQADATARRGIEISAFAGPAGVFTGLAGGHNISFSAGVDVGFQPFYGLMPALEVRGLYPVDGGTVDEQKNVLGGLRLEKRRNRTRLYGDILFGRGEINYLDGGFLDQAGTYIYYSNTSNVISPGVGVSYDITPLLGVVADAQFQHYDTPVTPSRSLWSKPIMIGVVFRLPAERHGHPYP